MKTMTALFLASCFLFLSAQTALAEDPIVNALDRHAAWSKGDSKSGKRDMARPSEETTQAHPVAFDGFMDSGAREGWDDFVHETKTYDFARDHGNTA